MCAFFILNIILRVISHMILDLWNQMQKRKTDVFGYLMVLKIFYQML